MKKNKIINLSFIVILLLSILSKDSSFINDFYNYRNRESSNIKQAVLMDNLKDHPENSKFNKEAELKENRYQSIEENTDPIYKSEWYIEGVEANRAWNLINQKREIKVAVLDTGVDYNHPDLKNRLNLQFAYNFVDNNKNIYDDNGHGTEVTGIIAAESNNGVGITGVVGNTDVKIIPIKVLNSKGEGKASDIAAGIEYASSKGADIINLSFDSEGKDKGIDNALEYARKKGVFVVSSAGNDNANSNEYIIAGNKDAFVVSAVNNKIAKADFSNYGENVKAWAPGVSIMSTAAGGTYKRVDGTSVAAPIVAGIAAMLKAEQPKLTPEQLEHIIMTTSHRVPVKRFNTLSKSVIVDAYSAVKMVKNKEKELKKVLY